MEMRMNNKLNKIKMIVFTIVYVIGIVVLEKLFEYIFDDLLKSLLWWSSIVFLITGMILFCIYINRKFNMSNRKYFVCIWIFFMAIGEILLIVDSILFIKKIIVAILLILSVTFIYLSIVLFQYFLSQIIYDTKNILNKKD